MAGPPPGAAPHAFVADLDRPVLADDDRHHVERVLRLRPGDLLTVSDGAGGWRACRLAADPEPAGEVHRVPRPSPLVTVAFALVKGGRAEWAVQKLTEVGTDRIVPFTAARSVVRWDEDRRQAQVARLRRVAREAAMQSRRVWLPSVEPVTDFAAAAARDGAALADRGGAAPSLDHPTVLVGPEGGWSPEERGAGLPTVAVSEQVLRAETAAVVVGALLVALRADLVTWSGDHSP